MADTERPPAAHTDFCKNIVEEAGYIATVTPAGDIAFRSEGHGMLLELYADDEHYVRLGSLYRIDEDASLDQLMRAANETNRELKAVKSAIVADDGRQVLLVVERFVCRIEDLSGIFDRSIRAMLSARDHFFKSLG